jgi:hypothetical protein
VGTRGLAAAAAGPAAPGMRASGCTGFEAGVTRIGNWPCACRVGPLVRAGPAGYARIRRSRRCGRHA